MAYHGETLKDIKEKYAQIQNIYEHLIVKITLLNQKLESEKAHEYLMQGVGRRLKVLNRCIHNIFYIFPIEHTEQLTKDSLADLDINLHAFFVNISGVFDNLAWVFIYESNLYGSEKEGKINKHGVGLFNPKTQKHLNTKFKNYLNDSETKNWYSDYSKNYRDALAHRIPLYVPPSVLDKEEEKEYLSLEKEIKNIDINDPDYFTKYDEIIKKQKILGKASPFFTHSIDEGSRLVYIHAQIITDFITVEELINKFIEYNYE